MSINERYTLFIDYFSAAMPNADTELHYTTTFELLCAVMLSAQCTDRRVNLVTPQLFSVYPTAQDLASATPNDVYQIIRSVSYPNSKAAHLVAMAAQLVSLHNGEVPSTLEALTALPGVGRKTANVVLSVAFGQPRMPVDTHVFRVSHRIGLVPSSCTTPLSVEQELVKHIPPAIVTRAHHWLILHGRYVCKSLSPLCGTCPIKSFCKQGSKSTKDAPAKRKNIR